MKITDVKPYVSMPIAGLPWIFVVVETDEGISGVGECTDYASTGILVRGLEWVKREVIGQDARNIENIWQTIFHKYDDLNGRGFVSHLISAIDIAVWDIKGKALGAPIYQLLGGPVRERVPLYTHVQDWNSNAGGPDDAAKAAIATKNAGYAAIKTDPFPAQAGPVSPVPLKLNGSRQRRYDSLSSGWMRFVQLLAPSLSCSSTRTHASTWLRL